MLAGHHGRQFARLARHSRSAISVVKHMKTTTCNIASGQLRSATHSFHSTSLTIRAFSSQPARLLPTATALPNSQQINSPTIYTPPNTRLISKLPLSWQPYAELVRLDKPTGTYYLYFPCLYSTLMAAPLATPMASVLDIAWYAGLFSTGSLIMRGAGCTINDLWDRNLDPHVERTKFRPIARGAISPRRAIVYLGFQMLAGLGILLSFPAQCFFYATPSLILVALYPLAKRVTNYPQAVLGLTFTWGAWMGFPALGVDLLSNTDAAISAACLYASCWAWTMNYDMIYAHMDIKDDLKAGIKSIALAHEHNTKAVLSVLTVAQVGLLAAAGYFSGAAPSSEKSISRIPKTVGGGSGVVPG
ncbi:Para-hydroxybenzoate--polyprenyltransferase, mitochondrial precursor (PHB:polyprenyltransferase) [Exophiala xenobiotica]|uniref:Para-hydroxybenzoate--polyprenyltransferase, mitochondrial (PHB:polyprenyltransferase) n=1 Tax=Lithohypha guttulata TaxID=1690604 RepID=A0ABR0KES6_9EURO|nr:Para-hydroxybenzoate--polyprenyltransferase, mitochondrial precursor (PHB:polyprenyltransferase) [Lithohypha guttulata]KAK5322232.1 Para-hydroxybenzoate--polyprenyltransferase, mitochondrial precursor (PHB:polyprenyltransferase) [Exophiala xenobiotica]